jgi:hypothetical protein
VSFEIAFPGTNFLDRQGVVLESLVERQGAATQCLKHRSFTPDRPPPGVERRQFGLAPLAHVAQRTENRLKTR